MTNSQLSPQEAARLLLLRRSARESIIGYAQAIDIPGAPVSDSEDCETFAPVESSLAQHHKLILESLDRISRTPHGRLMIFAPPGSAKSSYASVVFPSAFLGREPGRRLILASYGDDLARKMGKRTRSIIRQDRYQGIFGTALTSDSQAAQEFALTNGSEYMACGILSGVTGNRAHGLVIDDPIKGRQQANSQAVRETTWSAYQDDLKTRLVPGGWICLIQTRWHELDLAGRILPENWKGESGIIRCRDGMDWEVICLQARCETDTDPLGRAQGEYLWPEWFDRQHWAQFEASPITWASLYQQRPSPLEGGLFKPDKIEIVEAIPSGTRFVRAWDFAATQDGGDWTVGAKMGITPSGKPIIADIVRFRGGPEAVEEALLNTARRDSRNVRIRIPQDPGQAGKAQAESFVRMLSGFSVHALPVTGDKVTRAEPFAAQVNVGNVLMLRADWNDALISEMRMFPNGNHDDQIDAVSDGFSECSNARVSFFG